VKGEFARHEEIFVGCALWGQEIDISLDFYPSSLKIFVQNFFPYKQSWCESNFWFFGTFHFDLENIFHEIEAEG
jgi:hypothetical protein